MHKAASNLLEVNPFQVIQILDNSISQIESELRLAKYLPISLCCMLTICNSEAPGKIRRFGLS